MQLFTQLPRNCTPRNLIFFCVYSYLTKCVLVLQIENLQQEFGVRVNIMNRENGPYSSQLDTTVDE